MIFSDSVNEPELQPWNFYLLFVFVVFGLGMKCKTDLSVIGEKTAGTRLEPIICLYRKESGEPGEIRFIF